MKIGHISDLHYHTKRLEWIDKATGTAIDECIRAGCEVLINSGDSFHHQVGLHEQPAHRFLARMRQAANAFPVLVLQGTRSHDHPGTLDALHTIGGHHHVCVADRIGQVALIGNTWHWSDGAVFDRVPDGARLIVSVLPSVNRGDVAASVGVENAAGAAADLIHQLCLSWSTINRAAADAGIPTVMVSHGTVAGAVTESRHAMVSQDHEFSSGQLFDSGASAVMLGHIHAHQHWEDGGRCIAYPGSITRLIHGHDAPTGFLLWDVGATSSGFHFHETPAVRLIELDFNGAPDMAEVEAAGRDCAGAHVRVRYQVDEDHRHSVDHTAIEAAFSEAERVKIEPRILPIVRSRAEGISAAHTLESKLVRWAEITDTPGHHQLCERLQRVQTEDPADIARGIINQGKGEVRDDTAKTDA